MNLTRRRKTGQPEVVPTSDGRLTISVPIQIKRRSGRKLATLPAARQVRYNPGMASRWLSSWHLPGGTDGLPCWSRAMYSRCGRLPGTRGGQQLRESQST